MQAHTAESCASCSAWFEATASPGDGALRILVFNCSGDRKPLELLSSFASLPPQYRITHAVFCPIMSSDTSGPADNINRTVDTAKLVSRTHECN